MNIRLFERTDTKNYVALQNLCIPNQPISQKDFERDLETLSIELQYNIFVAELAGQIVGAANIHCYAGSYHPQKFKLELFVQPQHRGQGMGRALYQAIENWLKNKNPIRIAIQVREHETIALQFAARRGYQEIKRDFESLLHAQAFDAAPFLGINERVLKRGYQIFSFADLDSEKFRHDFHAAFETVRVDIPRSEPPTPLSFSFFNEHITASPEFLRHGSFFALHQGKIVGFSGTYFNQEKNWVDQWLTATLRPYRGQEIAMALKLRVVQFAQESGYRTIRTDNDTRNTSMLAINDKLGFVRQNAVLAMAKTFEPKNT